MSSEEKCIRIIKIIVKCVTGNEVSVEVDQNSSVDDLKDVISRELSIPINSFSIQANYKELIDGSLLSNEIEDLSEIVVIPVIKSGLKMRCKDEELDEVTDITSSKKMVEKFFAGKALLVFNALINERIVKVRVRYNTVEAIAENRRKLTVRRGKRKSQVPRYIKSLQTHLFVDNDSEKAEDGSTELLKKIDVLTVLELLNSTLTEMAKSGSKPLSGPLRIAMPIVTTSDNKTSNSTGIQHTPREDLIQKMKTHATMQKLLEELKQRKLKRQKSTDLSN